MGQKVDFNANTKIITVTQAPDSNGDIAINVKQDIYSDGKEDWVGTESLRKFRFPISVIGGQNTTGERKMDATFFLNSDWKIQPYSADHRLIIEGNLYATDGSDPILTVNGCTVKVVQNVSSIVTLMGKEEIEQTEARTKQIKNMLFIT
jgi:hypothetical protein